MNHVLVEHKTLHRVGVEVFVEVRLDPMSCRVRIGAQTISWHRLPAVLELTDASPEPSPSRPPLSAIDSVEDFGASRTAGMTTLESSLFDVRLWSSGGVGRGGSRALLA